MHGVMRTGPKMVFYIPELVKTTDRPVGFIHFAKLIEQKRNNIENKTMIITCK